MNNLLTQDHLKSFLIADCGTGTTTVILVERTGTDHRIVARGVAPTTTGDVTLGLIAAVRQIEESTGKHLLEDDRVITRRDYATAAADEFICTSSVGGGLQMMVAGLVGMMTAESAERAALGAGAVVLDVISIDDGRLPHQKIQRIRDLRPDMFLLSGGTDGGNISGVLQLAELIKAAKPHNILPVIFAGNRDARDQVAAILSNTAELHMVDNLRPVLEEEVLVPTGVKIHEQFMKHVVALAPGYDKLAQWTTRDILPTSAAVGDMIEIAAREERKPLLGVNIGNEMTDVFSVFEERFTRTVSGDLGLGSSIYNVLREATLPNVLRWLPFEISLDELANRLRNKMLRPSLLPVTARDLMIEHAMAREALRLALEEHKSSVVGLRGIRRPTEIAKIFDQTGSGDTLVNLMKLDLIIGSGAVFTSAPRPLQSMMILVDAFQPQGVTHIAIDHSYVAPHLGALANVDAYAAVQVYKQSGLTYLGTVVAPVGSGKVGEPCLTIEIKNSAGEKLSKSVSFGGLEQVPCDEGTVSISVKPTAPFDLGRGRGKAIRLDIPSGLCGVVVDARGRGLSETAIESPACRQLLTEWYSLLDLYPESKGE